MQHNLYGEALGYLLGVARSRHPLTRLHYTWTWWETGHNVWQTAWEGWLYYQGETSDLSYRVELSNQGAAATTYAKLQWYNGGTWQDLTGELTATGTSLTVKDGSISISALGWDGLVRLRWQIRSSSASYAAIIYVWYVGVCGRLDAWQTPPTFSARVSSAGDWNTLKADLDLLYTERGRAPQPLSVGLRRISFADQDVWVTVGRFCDRYSKGNATAYIQVRGPTVLNGARWRVVYRECGSSSIAALYTSGGIHGDLTSWGWYSATLDLSGLTSGTWYAFYVEAMMDSGSGMEVRLSSVVHDPGTVDVAWQAPPVWAHGNKPVNPADCQVLTDDLLLLYTGGAEEMQGRNRAQISVPVSQMPLPYEDREANSEKHPPVHLGVRRWRWLRYQVDEAFDEPPRLVYGVGFKEAMSLPTDGANADGWAIYDLDSVEGLLIGDVYLVEHVRSVMETCYAET